MDTIFTPADIEVFRTIWREEFDEELTPDRARAEAESLLNLVYQLRTIYRRSLKVRAQTMTSTSLDSSSNAAMQ